MQNEKKQGIISSRANHRPTLSEFEIQYFYREHFWKY